MMRTDDPQTVFLKDYQPSHYLIDHVSLDFHLEPNETRVIARLDIRVNPAAAASNAALVLDGENIRLRSIAFTGVPVGDDQYMATADKLVIENPPQEAFTLELETICDPTANTELSGLYRSGGNYCTQCEAEGFRRITYFLDRPDILSRYRVRIQGDKELNPVLLSNGNKVLEGDVEGGNEHFAVWEDPYPKPCYLFALVAGDLAHVEDKFVTTSGRTVALKIYVEHGKQDRCDWAMASLKRSMKWDEETFDREYDLDIFMIVAVSDFNMGAMENKGLNIFNDKYILARPETATDLDYANIEAIIAHEYFHNWSGNRITCRDWFQLCLKEGLTVFRDQEFSADVRSRPVKRISDVRTLRSHQFPEDAGPLAHPVRPQSYMEINNFYTATIYEKGAEVVRMMQTLIGHENFRQAMDLYFARHDGEAATVEDFVRCMTDTSGRDFSQFFAWYNEAGTPDVIAETSYDAKAQTYQLKLSQNTKPTPGQNSKKPFHIPLAIGLVGPDGSDMALIGDDASCFRNNVVELTKAEQTITFKNISAKPVLSLNRSFSAPINLASNLGFDEKLFLMANDSDSFNRFEAARDVGIELIISAMEQPDEPIKNIEAFNSSLLQVLGNDELEPAFVAQMLSLPDEASIASVIGENVDPENIHDARNRVLSQIGRALDDGLMEAYQRALSLTYTPDAASAGLRSLKFAALTLLAAADVERGAELAFRQFIDAAHMTAEFNALVVLTRLDVDQRSQALSQFYERHKDDHLLVDKWFGLNAQCPFPETLGQIRDLMNHEAFSLKKPNTVRSLIGGFAMANPVYFNEIDGSGYELYSDVIVELDKINPQVAARLSSAFRSWRMLEPVRSELAKSALERINRTNGLSKDTFDITSRSLGQ